jgi:hypothetical protein
MADSPYTMLAQHSQHQIREIHIKPGEKITKIQIESDIALGGGGKRTRKASRKNRKASRKNRKASRKNRKGSRRH